MRLIFQLGRIEIWAVPEDGYTEFYVYGVTDSGDPRVCPSLGMAREVAAAARPCREAQFQMGVA